MASWNNLTADIIPAAQGMQQQQKVFSIGDPRVQDAVTQARNTHSGIISLQLKWVILILGLCVFGLVLYLYFRNANLARQRLRRQAAGETVGTMTAAEFGAIMVGLEQQPSEGSPVTPANSQLYTALQNLMRSGGPRTDDALPMNTLRVRVVDSQGWVYADNAAPDNAVKQDGNMPATSIGNRRTADTNKPVLQLFMQTAGKGGGFVSFSTEDVRISRNAVATFYVAPVRHSTWMIVLDIPQ